MARRARNAVPDYLLHKASGKAYVNIDGKVIYLPGEFESKESRGEYDRLVALWMLNGRSLATAITVPTPPAATAASVTAQSSAAVAAQATTVMTSTYTVGEFVRDYLVYAQTRYAKHGTFYSIRSALRPLVKFFEDLPLVEYGPKKLIQTRLYFIKKNLVRREVNRRIYWIKNAIRWAVSQELVPGETIYRLDAVEELHRGEEGVRESTKVHPVDESVINATLPHMAPEIAAMVRIQLLTGARSGEVCQMRACDIDMTKEVWVLSTTTSQNRRTRL